MNIQATKIELIKLILNTSNQSRINKALSIFKSDVELHKPEFTKDQIEEIKLGLEQLEKGYGVKFKDFLKKVS